MVLGSHLKVLYNKIPSSQLTGTGSENPVPRGVQAEMNQFVRKAAEGVLALVETGNTWASPRPRAPRVSFPWKNSAHLCVFYEARFMHLQGLPFS